MESDKRLYRSESNRMIAGVAGGLGQYFGLDPTLVRLGFVVLAFLGGSGIVAYLVAWIIVPSESKRDTPPRRVPAQNLEDVRDTVQRGARGAKESYERWRGKGEQPGPPSQSAPSDAPPADTERSG